MAKPKTVDAPRLPLIHAITRVVGKRRTPDLTDRTPGGDSPTPEEIT
jgi:hypothetical protein